MKAEETLTETGRLNAGLIVDEIRKNPMRCGVLLGRWLYPSTRGGSPPDELCYIPTKFQPEIFKLVLEILEREIEIYDSSHSKKIR